MIRSPAPRGCTAPQPVDAQLVRPFAGWLVHAAAAAGHVGTMSAVSGAGRSALSSVNPAAYEPMPPALYVYRQSTPYGQHTGIVCDVTPEAFLDGRVLGHESVQPERVEGLARYLATMPQHVELVSTLHRAGPVVRATLALVPGLPPDRDVVAPDGVTRPRPMSRSRGLRPGCYDGSRSFAVRPLPRRRPAGARRKMPDPGLGEK